MDDNQTRELALESGSFIIEAPAGSGKTELLTQRFLHLISKSINPENILAVTFTNKAASEMKHRIISYIRGDQAPKSEITKRILSTIKKEISYADNNINKLISNLNIMTIDALANRVCQQMPLMSKYASNSNITENVDHLLIDAINEIFSSKDNIKILTDLSQQLSVTTNDLERYFLALLKSRDTWIYDIFETYNEERSFEKYLLIEEKELLVKINQFFDLSKNFFIKDKKIWLEIIDNIYTKSGEIRKKISLTFLDKIKKNLFISLIEKGKIPSYNEILYIEYFFKIKLTQDENLLKNTNQILKLLLAELKISFTKNNTLDFIEVNQNAIYSLFNEHGDTNLNHNLSSEFTHILVDEFQDINQIQLRLFQLLSKSWGEGQSFFCVGDPMQSIYRFRKAEVSLFLQTISKGIGQTKLEHLKLKVNNRSEPKLINWFNKIFSSIFSSMNDLDLGSIKFSKSEAKSKINSNGEINYFNFEDNGNYDGCEGELIAQEIINSKYKKIAVIGRSRSHLRPIISYIKRNYQHLIAITSVEVESLYDHQCIQDILNLTIALNDFSNRVAWIGLLRSPLCGLTLEELSKLFEENHDEYIYVLLQNYQDKKIIESTKKRIEFFLKVITASLDKANKSDWGELLRSTWENLSGDNTLLNESDYILINQYLQIIDEDESLINEPIKLIAHIKSKYTSDISKLDKHVEFLTIHKSKGLEFDHVIIPGLNRRPKNNDTKLILFDYKVNEQRSYYSINNNNIKTGPSLYEYHKLKEKIRDENELKRLLYVACTRAISRLDLVSSLPKDKYPIKNTLLSLIWFDFKNAETIKVTPKNLKISFSRNNFRVLDIKNYIKNISINNKDKNYAVVENIEHENIYTVIGNIAHLLIELIHKAIISKQTRTLFVSNLLKKMSNISNIDKKFIEDELKIIINKIDTENDASFIMQKFNNDESELSISSILSSEIKTIRIDRTFIKDNIRWIIDYKYVYEDKDLNKEALKHRDQLKHYSTFFNDQNISMAVYFLKQGRLISIA